MLATPLQNRQLPVEIIKEHVYRTQGSDPLDTVLSPHYIAMFTNKALQMAVAPLSKTRVVLSRYYPGPNVAVDFEPQDRPFHVDAKRQWCHLQGTVYVPIYKRDRLTPMQFLDRLKDGQDALADAQSPAPATLPPIVSMTAPAVSQARPEASLLLADADVQTALVDAGTAVVLAKYKTIKPAKLAVHRAEWLTQTTAALIKDLDTGEIAPTKDVVLAWVAARRGAK